MDFDSIISFLFLIAFFILPAILKRVKGVNKKTASPGNSKKKPSVFDRINAKIQKFVREFEQQAKQQKQTDKTQDSPWDALADDQAASQSRETFDLEDDDFRAPEYEIPDMPVSETKKHAYHSTNIKSEKDITQQSIKKSECEQKKITQYPNLTCLIFKSNPLQNAIIWSEILGKPVGLRE